MIQGLDSSSESPCLLLKGSLRQCSQCAVLLGQCAEQLLQAFDDILLHKGHSFSELSKPSRQIELQLYIPSRLPFLCPCKHSHAGLIMSGYHPCHQYSGENLLIADPLKI